jgi:anti-sigma regulatory factor (Ser/Thr protein kinase)
VRFSLGDLRQVHREVAGWAAQAGLPDPRAVDFVIAVYEIAANALRHRLPVAQLELKIDGAVALPGIRTPGPFEMVAGQRRQPC